MNKRTAAKKGAELGGDFTSLLNCEDAARSVGLCRFRDKETYNEFRRAWTLAYLIASEQRAKDNRQRRIYQYGLALVEEMEQRMVLRFGEQ